MMNSAPRTVNLDSQSLDKVIKALSDVVKDFNLTRRERISYWGLMLSADLAIAHFLITFVWLFSSIFVLNFVDKSIVDATVTPPDWFKNVLGLLFILSLLALLLSILAGVPSLLFSISLLRKTFQERAKLELLGITGLTKSLWKESRRSRWLSRLRSGFLIFISVYMIIGAVSVSIFVKALTLRPDLAFELESALYPNLGIIGFGRMVVAVAVWLAIMLFTARYLRNQREQIDLAANAGQLRSVLEKMLQHAGVAGCGRAAQAPLTAGGVRPPCVPSARPRSDGDQNAGARRSRWCGRCAIRRAFGPDRPRRRWRRHRPTG